MKLLFIFTGGTIGSAVSGDYISTDENKPYELIETYRKRYGLECYYDIMTPYTELSEQNTGVTVSKLIACVCDAIDNGGKDGAYDGIIVTHGTDTLPYSAAALSYALGNDSIPVCIVSSNYPITDHRANGVDNLYGAIKLIEAGRRAACCGVFVSYRNHVGVTYLHRASRLLETPAFSDEYLSVRNEYYGKIVNDTFHKNPEYKENADKLEPMGAVALKDICDGITRYHLYPGIRLEEASECILLESFHSGTMNTKLTDYQRYFEKMYEQGVPVYLTGLTRGVSYESTSLYEKLHIQPVYDIAPVAAYMKLWMLMAAGRKWSADMLNLPLGGDM